MSQILYQIPRVGYSFQTRLGWGENLFNLAKMVVLVLYKEAERKAQVHEVSAHAAEEKKQIRNSIT